MSEKKHDEPMEPVLSQTDQVAGSCEYYHDAVFGEMAEGGPNYRNVSPLEYVSLTVN